MDFRKDLINVEMLDELIESYKNLYLQSYANVLKLPSLTRRCEEGIAETENEEKKEALKEQIEKNNYLILENKANMQNSAEMHDSLLSFKNSL